MNLHEVQQMPPDGIIYSIEGTIKKLWPPKTGTNAKGDWSIQKGVLTIEGGEIEFMLKDRDPLHQHAQGRRMKFEAYKGPKGFSGCYAKDDDYKGNITRMIYVTPTGLLTYIDGKAAPHNEPPPQEPPPQQRQQSQPQNQQRQTDQQTQTKAPPPQNGTTEAMQEVADSANQIANLQLLVMQTVDSYVIPRVEHKTGRKVSDQERSALTMNMLIELMRSGGAWKMPKWRAKDKPAEPQTGTGEYVF